MMEGPFIIKLQSSLFFHGDLKGGNGISSLRRRGNKRVCSCTFDTSTLIRCCRLLGAHCDKSNHHQYHRAVQASCRMASAGFAADDKLAFSQCWLANEQKDPRGTNPIIFLSI